MRITEHIILKTFRLPDKSRQTSLLVCRWPNSQSDMCGGCPVQATTLIRQGILQCCESLTRIFSGVLSFIFVGDTNKGKPCDKREIIGDKLQINENKLRPGAAQSKVWTCGRLIVGIAGSNSSGDIDVWHLWRRAHPPSRGVLPSVWSSTPIALCTYSE